MVVPVLGWGDGKGGLWEQETDYRKASNTAPSQSCLELEQTTSSQCLAELSVHAKSKLLGLHLLVSVATPDSISLPVPRLQHSVPAQAGMEAPAFCFVRGIVMAQTSSFVTKVCTAVKCLL